MPFLQRSSLLTPYSLLLPPMGIIVFLWLTSANPVTLEAAAYAFLLLLLPWFSFLKWRQEQRAGLPLFAMVGLAYWWYFAIGLFWLEREVETQHGIAVVDDKVTATIWMALVGVACIGIGMKIRVRVQGAVPRRLELYDHPTTWIYVRWVLVLGTIGSLVPGSYNLLGADARQIMEIFLSTVPTAALLLILRRCLEDRESKLDRMLLWAYFPIRIGIALGSGWLGSAVNLGLVCGTMYFLVRRKVPWTVMAISMAVVLFLQVGKKEFRREYWDQGAEGGLTDKVTSWLSGSASKWSGALSGTSENSSRDLSLETLQRTSLLLQVAHVVELTPATVPFQMGQTYSYLATALIPRFLWPDKPSMNEANRFYQVAYGLTDVRNLDTVSIGIGCLAEAYINFSWYGVVAIMLGIGAVLGIYQRAFVSNTSGELFLAIGLALLPGVLSIEAQMSAYLGGIVQHIGLTLIVFLPVVRRKAYQTWPQQGRPELLPTN